MTEQPAPDKSMPNSQPEPPEKPQAPEIKAIRPEFKPKPQEAKPKKRPKPEPILEYEGLKAGEAVELPYSDRSVTINHFYRGGLGGWYAIFDGGSVRASLLKKRAGEAQAESSINH